MDKTSHEKSQLAIAFILARLFENGLQHVIIDGKEFSDDADVQPFIHTSLRWLMDEGLVRVKATEERSDGFAVSGPVLTAKGYDVLGELDPSGNSTLGEKIVEVGKAGGNLAATTALSEIVGAVIGAIAKSYSS